MATTNTLDKFIKAQDKLFQVAFEEIKNGKKKSHWMWFIFPQIKGLGFSEMSHYYAIENLQEAQEYLNHPVLGKRLMEISSALLQLATDDPNLVFGSPDDMKLRSSMTLFASVTHTDGIFKQVLEKYFNGKMDPKTLRIVNLT